MGNLAKPLQIFLWSYVFIYAVFSSLSITQVDLWWQLSEGAHILRTWSLPTGPAAAYGLPAPSYFDEYAGYEVVLALLYKFTGFVGLWLVFSAIYLAILFLPVAMTARRYPLFDLRSTVALLTAILILGARLQQRPELVGVLLQVLLMVHLRASSLEKIGARELAPLFLLFLVWTNTHDTFVFGFFTLGLWIVSESWSRSRSTPVGLLLRHGVIWSAVAFVATILNPFGPRRLVFPFLQISDPGSTALSPEMWPLHDFATPLGVFFLIALGLMIWAMRTTRGLPPWLIAFAIFSVAMSLRSFRFVELTAISLLFLSAAREPLAEAKAHALAWLVALTRALFLAVLCVLFLFLDVFNLLATYVEMRSETTLATHGLRYASDIAEYPVETSPHPLPVLCSECLGSYLSFEGHGHFRPLLDSGLSHFSDDTKRYFFFVWNEPDALKTALDHLSVNYVLLDLDTFPWIPTLHRLPDWQFVACTANGMIWKRNPGGPPALSEGDRAEVSAAVTTLIANDHVMGAFAYSTLLDDPGKSLAILATYSGSPWPEPFFNSVRGWLDAIPPADAQTFLASNRGGQYPLLGAMVAARLGPDAYAAFINAHPQHPGGWYAQAVAVEMLLQQKDLGRARAVFDAISPAPAASTTYYRLWHAVHDGDGGTPLNAYGRWQSWNAREADFIIDESGALNIRLTNLNRPD